MHVLCRTDSAVKIVVRPLTSSTDMGIRGPASLPRRVVFLYSTRALVGFPGSRDMVRIG